LEKRKILFEVLNSRSFSQRHFRISSNASFRTTSTGKKREELALSPMVVLYTLSHQNLASRFYPLR